MRSFNKILQTLANAGIAYINHPGRDASSLYKAIRKFKELQKISDPRLKRSLVYSMSKGYIHIYKANNKAKVQLTNKGKKLLEKDHLLLTPQKQDVWDRKWRIVIFDIPELHKKNRDGFARSLKIIGFTQIQKSVFAFPYPCKKELETLVEFHSVKPFVTILIVESMGNSNRLEKIYSL